MRLSQDQLGGLFMLAFSTAYGALIFDIPVLASASGFDARSMPFFLAGLGILFSLLLVTRSGPAIDLGKLNFKLGTYFIVLLLAYSFAIRSLGFAVSTFVFLAVGFWLLGERTVWKTLLIAAGVTVIFWLIMSSLLGVYLALWPEAIDA